MTLSMDDLLTKFDNVNLLCTLVCAGNRRKEQNMVKKTKGFNWGASGTGTGEQLQEMLPLQTVVALPHVQAHFAACPAFLQKLCLPAAHSVIKNKVPTSQV